MAFSGILLGVAEGKHKCSTAERSSCLNVETEPSLSDVGWGRGPKILFEGAHT